MDLKVTYRSDFDSPAGYSRAARAHAKALIEAGVDVVCENAKHDVNTVPLDPFWARELPVRVGRKEHTPIKIWHETPEFYAPNPGQINVAMLAWETSHIPMYDTGKPRQNWVKQLNKMTEVWTFCQSAKRALVDSGVETPITVLGHPVDPTLYHPPVDGERELLYDSCRRAFGPEWTIFLAVFHWTPRKDPYTLLKAYLTEFFPDEKVLLVLKTHLTRLGDLAQIRNQLHSVKSNVVLPHAQPRILVLPGALSDTEMGALYRSVHCFLSTSRGEGFCLPAAEALASGVPVIAGNHTAFRDYLTEETGYLVESRPEPVYGLGNIPWYYSTQTWWTLDQLDFKKRLREAYENRVGLAHRARQAPTAVARFAPETIGKKMAKALRRLLAGQGGRRADVVAVARERAGAPPTGI